MVNFISHGETFLPDEEPDSERQDCFVISHLFDVMDHGQRKKVEAQQLSLDNLVLDAEGNEVKVTWCQVHEIGRHGRSAVSDVGDAPSS